MNFFYVIAGNPKEVMLFADNNIYRFYEAYHSKIIDGDLLSEIASKLNSSAYPAPVDKISSELIEKLNDFVDIYYIRRSAVGTQKPYSQEIFEREAAAISLLRMFLKTNRQLMQIIKMPYISSPMPWKTPA